MIYVFIVLLVLFCVYESYSLFMSIRKKLKEKKEKSLKTLDSGCGEVAPNDPCNPTIEQNSQENLEEGEKQD